MGDLGYCPYCDVSLSLDEVDEHWCPFMIDYDDDELVDDFIEEVDDDNEE